MKKQRLKDVAGSKEGSFEARLAAYVAAAGAAATALSSTADAAIVANTTPQPFGVNGDVNIDFNSDGQIDYQIDHDRYNLNGTDLDYLQIDKNDVNSAANPLPINPNASFPLPPGVQANGDHGYLAAQGGEIQSFYPAALNEGDVIGFTPPGTRSWDFQETDNAFGRNMGEHRRHNRLIDEDRGQIDASFGKATLPPTDAPEWVGLEGQTRYLGVRLDLNDSAKGYNPFLDPPANDNYWYGWIGVQITNETDATGIVTGWAYESTMNTPIAAGDAGPGVVNADYDDDGDVDGADFLVWQRTLGDSVANGTSADGSSNGVVDGADLDLWESQFGGGSATTVAQISAAAVPEPGSMLLAGLSGCFLLCWFVLKSGVRKLAPARVRRPT